MDGIRRGEISRGQGVLFLAWPARVYSAGQLKSKNFPVPEPKNFRKNRVHICAQGG